MPKYASFKWYDPAMDKNINKTIFWYSLMKREMKTSKDQIKYLQAEINNTLKN